MRGTSEPDVERDDHTARTREAGGVDPDTKKQPQDMGSDPDGGATTGTDESQEFVGRVAGQDAGYAGETGAEARAEAGEK